jgi:predicted transcriptional regulator
MPHKLAILEDFDMPDLNLPNLIDLKDSVLELENVPDRAVIIISLHAMGYGAPRISAMLDVSSSTVAQYLRRYDPEGKSNISKDDKKIITTMMMQSVAVEALMNITSEKLKSASAKDLAGIATRCATAVEKLDLSKKFGEAISTTRIDSMIDALDVTDV